METTSIIGRDPDESPEGSRNQLPNLPAPPPPSRRGLSPHPFIRRKHWFGESLQGHKESVCGTAEGARMSAEGGDRCRINYLNFIYFLHIHNIYNVFNIYLHICI